MSVLAEMSAVTPITLTVEQSATLMQLKELHLHSTGEMLAHFLGNLGIEGMNSVAQMLGSYADLLPLVYIPYFKPQFSISELLAEVAPETPPQVHTCSDLLHTAATLKERMYPFFDRNAQALLDYVFFDRVIQSLEDRSTALSSLVATWLAEDQEKYAATSHATS